jgi:hypothetical protein
MGYYLQAGFDCDFCGKSCRVVDLFGDTEEGWGNRGGYYHDDWFILPDGWAALQTPWLVREPWVKDPNYGGDPRLATACPYCAAKPDWNQYQENTKPLDGEQRPK